MSYTIVVGADPGYTGALAFGKLTDTGRFNLVTVDDMPVAAVKSGRSTKNEVLLPELARLLDPSRWPLAEAVLFFTERVGAMPGQGVTSMFRFGKVVGQIEGVAAAHGLAMHYRTPAEWQRIAQVRADPEAGLLRANQLFPSAPFFGRKKDHNRADAALIAYAGAYTLLGRLPLTA